MVTCCWSQIQGVIPAQRTPTSGPCFSHSHHTRPSTHAHTCSTVAHTLLPVCESVTQCAVVSKAG